MKIGVLSDTHVYCLDDLSNKIFDELSGVDLIIHAGDYIDYRLVEDLKRLGNFKGVHGNMDSNEVKERLPSTEIVDIGGVRIGITHPAEGGSPFILDEIITKKFPKVDVIVYGHSHIINNNVKQGVLLFNPGSATGRFADYKTFGILNIDNHVKGRIIRI